MLENLAEPVRFLDDFISSKRSSVQGTTLTLVDICRGGAVNCMNTKRLVSPINYIIVSV